MEKVEVTCPECGAKTEVEMKEGMCQAMFRCSGCGKTITAKEYCCVICEYSDKHCPVSTKDAKEAA